MSKPPTHELNNARGIHEAKEKRSNELLLHLSQAEACGLCPGLSLPLRIGDGAGNEGPNVEVEVFMEADAGASSGT